MVKSTLDTLGKIAVAVGTGGRMNDPAMLELFSELNSDPDAAKLLRDPKLKNLLSDPANRKQFVAMMQHALALQEQKAAAATAADDRSITTDDAEPASKDDHAQS